MYAFHQQVIDAADTGVLEREPLGNETPESQLCREPYGLESSAHLVGIVG
jgi:hypothetical protein